MTKTLRFTTSLCSAPRRDHALQGPHPIPPVINFGDSTKERSATVIIPTEKRQPVDESDGPTPLSLE